MDRKRVKQKLYKLSEEEQTKYWYFNTLLEKLDSDIDKEYIEKINEYKELLEIKNGYTLPKEKEELNLIRQAELEKDLMDNFSNLDVERILNEETSSQNIGENQVSTKRSLKPFIIGGLFVVAILTAVITNVINIHLFDDFDDVKTSNVESQKELDSLINNNKE